MKELSLLLLLLLSSGTIAESPPQLYGMHLRITVVEEPGLLEIAKNEGKLHFNGPLVDWMDSISLHANFSYTLLPPSGRGSTCQPRVLGGRNDFVTGSDYPILYRRQGPCGAADAMDEPRMSYSTDVYFGSAVSAKSTWTELPVTSVLVGMNLASWEDIVAADAPVCAQAGTTMEEYLTQTHPNLHVVQVQDNDSSLMDALRLKRCTVAVLDRQYARDFLQHRVDQGDCQMEYQPLQTIPGPRIYGLGVRKHADPQIATTLSHWISVLTKSCDDCNDLDWWNEAVSPFINPCTSTKDQVEISPSGAVTVPSAPIPCTVIHNDPDTTHLHSHPSTKMATGAIIGIVLGVFVALVVLLLGVACVLVAAHKYEEEDNEKMHLVQYDAKDPAPKQEVSSHSGSVTHQGSVVSCQTILHHLQKHSESLVENPRTLSEEEARTVTKAVQLAALLLKDSVENKTVAHLKLRETNLLNEVIDPVIALLSLGSSSIVFDTACSDHLLVYTNVRCLSQILLNAASAAAQQIAAGYVRIRATAEDQNVRIIVEDSGSHLVESYQNQDSESSKLHVSHQLAASIGAEISMEATNDLGIEGFPGTCVNLRLNQAPLNEVEKDAQSKQDDEASSATATVQTSVSTDQNSLPDHISVLFCDGDADVRCCFREALEAIGAKWSVKEAANMESAYRYALKGEAVYDIMFIDETLPYGHHSMDGCDLVAALRDEGITTTICGLLSEQNGKPHANFLLAGASATIYKPFLEDRDSLKRELIRILENLNSF